MKGPLDWIAVVAELLRRGLNVTATWFGDGAMRPEVQSALTRLDMQESVALPGFSAHRKELLSEIRRHDIFLFCHKTPESPRCLIESLMCGTPIVGYRSDFASDLVAEFGGGMFSEMNSIQELADIVERLATDRPKLISLTQQAASSGTSFSDEGAFRHRSDLIKRYLSH